ncbi:FAD-dependent oxidoreductase [Saccharopolyspora rectivirgula]|uniref:Isorenieratene synthase n=1 Tax=Saccharopolyspora rectivirgula TaxID=28042 RepID=A0A073BDL4_9PSEU|nr:FAD-dependent oxidoreductase [Saccharopolyspora rectivirgula]KEI45869.1 isorenieratene synthase [Saccharopolyspora rectivirgula]
MNPAVRVPRDPRAVRHLAPRGAAHADQLPRRPQVVVAGAGIAGLTAATALAERGVAVTVVEREEHLGGRVGAWTEQDANAGQLSVSRGFHAFFRQYYNLRALLQRTDPELRRLRSVPDYPLLDAHGRRDTFRGLPRTPPWNALFFALRSPTFRLRDLLALDARAAAPLAAVSVPEIYQLLDHVDAETLLERINFPRPARHLAFEVFSRSFFASPREMSAAELAVMFHLYFLGSAEGLVFDVPTSAFDTALWEPLRAHLESLGVRFRTGVAVTAVERPGAGFRVHTGTGEQLPADGVVLALDVAGLRSVVDASADLADPQWREQVLRLRTAPPFLVHRLWLDRPVSSRRPPFLATGGLAPLDNISVLDHYEREAQQWADRRGGSVVELHAYAVERLPGDEEARVRALCDRLVERLHQVYPETGSARVVAQRSLWRQDCPMFGLGDFARRPRVRTPFGGLVLAGDGIRIDLPVALMERAAATGWHAANTLLARWGLAGHELTSVPTRGRLAPLRAWASLGR